MASSDPSPVDRFKRHREALLPHVREFAEGISQLESRILERVDAYARTVEVVASQVRSSVERGQMERRQREYLEFLIHVDKEALEFQRRWRIVLVADPTSPGRKLAFVDTFFVMPVEAMSNLHKALHEIEPDRLLVVDRAAGQKPIFGALSRLVAVPNKGDVSRLVSKPPFELEDRRGEHDYAREDPVIVRMCMNEAPPRDFAERIVAEVYPSLAKTCGWRPGRSRLSRYAPDATKWERYIKAVRRRSPKLARVVGPFSE